MTAGSSSLIEDDYIDLVYGEFGLTNLADLEGAFRAFKGSKKNHLAIFFHGGLVSRRDGLAEADRLIDGYRGAGAYPFFFIWNSDLLTSLRKLLSPFADDAVIRRVVEQHIIFVSRQILALNDLSDTQRRSLLAVAERQRADSPPSLETLAELGRTIDSILAERGGEVTLPRLEERIQVIQAFEENLARDPTLVAFGRWMTQYKRFTPTVGRGILTRVWERLRSGHGHGLYTTLIEEVAIAMGLDLILADIWQSMKDDTDAAFQGDGTKYGGTAFLDCLAAAWKDDTRLTLIAHSAGAVYIDRMLEAIDDTLPKEIKANIVFIAAALSFEVFAKTIQDDVFKRRVGSYRFLALTDDREGGYWQVPGVYDKSGLYLLSALCERDGHADKALIGMQRYWSGKNPYNTTNIKTVTSTISTGELVWSPTSRSAPVVGHRANARVHEGFAVESETNASVQDFVS